MVVRHLLLLLRRRLLLRYRLSGGFVFSRLPLRGRSLHLLLATAAHETRGQQGGGGGGYEAVALAAHDLGPDEDFESSLTLVSPEVNKNSVGYQFEGVPVPSAAANSMNPEEQKPHVLVEIAFVQC